MTSDGQPGILFPSYASIRKLVLAKLKVFSILHLICRYGHQQPTPENLSVKAGVVGRQGLWAKT